MAKQIFRVDLSEESRDFQPVATEPGLAMLDKPGANFHILHRWFGDLVAEPEWSGEFVNFYVLEPEGGRIEDVYVYPATKKDLEGPLKADLDTLASRIKKAQPESSNEQLLLKIVRQHFGALTADLDKADVDCFFFKYRREGGPWRLVWCWGYQRTDLEPCPALICQNAECNILFVRRPKTKNRCPLCQAMVIRRKKGVVGTLQRLAIPLLLLLLLLLGLVYFFGQPKLVVTPGSWTGPPGGRVEFKVHEKKWFLFNTDVTARVVASTNDERVFEFSRGGLRGRARTMGNALASFHKGNLVENVLIVVGPPRPPKAIAIEPEQPGPLGIGSTARLRVWGLYDDGDPIDLTELASWEIADPAVLYLHGSRIEGVEVGKTKITASYLAKADAPPLTAAADVEVMNVDYKELDIDLAGLDARVTPPRLAIGQSAAMTVDGLDEAGNRYSFLGSSLLQLLVAPSEQADIDWEEDVLIGRTPGTGELNATVLRKGDDPLKASFAFTVSDERLLADGTFRAPAEMRMFVDEYRRIDVVTPSLLPVEAVSSDPNIVEVLAGSALETRPELAGRGVGEATVSLTQGESKATVRVIVERADLRTLRIEPAVVRVEKGATRTFRVIGVTADGREIDVAPTRLTWHRQPLADFVYFDPQELAVYGKELTTQPLEMVVSIDGSLRATGTVEVSGSPLLAQRDQGLWGGFDAYPPIHGVGRVEQAVITGPGGIAGRVVGDGLVLDRVGTGSVLGGYLPAGAVIESIGGVPLAGLGRDVIAGYLGGTGIYDAPIRYRLPDGTIGQATIPTPGVAVRQAVMVTNAQYSNFSPSGFSAVIQVQAREDGQYRVADESGNPLSDWRSIPAGGAATFQLDSVSAGGGGNTIYIERQTPAGTRSVLGFDLAPEGVGGGGMRPGGGVSPGSGAVDPITEILP